MRVLKYFESFSEESAKKLEIEHKTYLKRLSKNIINFDDDFQLIRNKILKYDISNFSYNDKEYDFWIKPDSNFISLINEINNYIEEKIPENITFDFSYDSSNLNLIDFKKGIPEILQNLGFGFKLYCFFISKIKFAVSDKTASNKAIHVWRGLIMNNNFYSFTSNQITGVFIKDQSNNEIKNILDKIKNYNSNIVNFNFDELIFDEELEDKIKEIYGSLDFYTQKH
jgi:hypothetical protein